MAGSALLAHLDSLYVDMRSVGLLPPVCEQVHLGVVDAGQFRSLMELLHTVASRCQQWEAGGKTEKGRDVLLDSGLKETVPAAAAAGDGTNVSSDGATELPLPSLSPSSHSSQAVSSTAAGGATRSPPSEHSTAALPPPSSSSPSSSSFASLSSPSPSSSSSPPSAPSSARGRGSRSSVSSPSSVARGGSGSGNLSGGSGDVVAAGVDSSRFCKPSRLITVYPSKPFLITPIHLERIYVTSRKAAECMSDEEKAELATITVRWMGKPTADELFLVATDVCALINIRKSNTAKTVAQFADGEKVSMPVHCSSGKGSSTHILTVLTLAGVRRLLTTSRSVLATSLLDYLTRIAVHLQHFPHFVPVNDPTKPTVTPLKPEQQTLLVPNPAANGMSPRSMPPPLSASSSSANAQPVSATVTESSHLFSAVLPYPSSDAHSVSTSSSGSSFLSPVVAALSSSVPDDVPLVDHSSSGANCSAPLPLASSRPGEPSPALSVSGALSDGAVWAVKREHDEVDSGRSEAHDGDRRKKRKVEESNGESDDQSRPAERQRRQQQQQQQPMDNSPIPLPLVDDCRTALYSTALPRAMSSGPQSPSAPDSPSALSYSHFPPGGLILPPLHYTHSPPFMAAQPPPLPFGEVSDLTYAPGPYHQSYYHSSRSLPYYLSPQHRPLTAPPIPPFSHHTLTQHKQPVDDYSSSGGSSSSAHSQQPTQPTQPMHGAAGSMNANSNNITNGSTQHTANGELALPPPLYQPIPQHTQTAAACSHCQHSQHQPHGHGQSVGVYSSRRVGPPVTPPPPQPPSAAYHLPAYSHMPPLSSLPPPSSVRSSNPPYSYASYNSPPSSYSHASVHHTFHQPRYAAP